MTRPCFAPIHLHHHSVMSPPLLVVFIIAVVSFIARPITAFSAVPTNEGLEIRVCHDRDCMTDGAKQANDIVKTLVQKGTYSPSLSSTATATATKSSKVTVSKCGCLGPCGKGPNVDVRIDGIRVKDSRVGQSNYYVFRQINSAEAVAEMLEIAGMAIASKESIVNKIDTDSTKSVQSTRSFWDFDRTTRIALQRLLYASVALPLVDAQEKGTWDVINGQVYENSYYIIAALVFIGSQFMGTSSTANRVNENNDFLMNNK